eukprot:GFKZ01014641.1.p1 GENE.GFKZ01014641.1~~GFKZ01014641.1.p1  ORF type:complete len:503 (-),score=41.99 GFKZ01014641.1:65-1573(-)
MNAESVLNAILISIIAACAAIVIFSLVYIHLASHPPLPGPPLRDYLPGGLVYSVFADARLLSECLKVLHRRYGDVCHTWFGPIRVVNVFHHSDISHVLTNVNDFARAPSFREAFLAVTPGALFTLEGRPHRQARQFFRTKFNHSMLSGFHSKMNNAVSEFRASLADVADTGPVDLAHVISMTAFRIITNVAFSSRMNPTQTAELSADVNKLVDEMIIDLVGYPVRQMLTAFGVRKNFFSIANKVRSYFRLFLEQRLEETRGEKDSRDPDMLDGAFEFGQGDQVKAVSLATEIAIAGSHTTTQTVLWTVIELCRNPRVERLLQQELTDVLKEKPGDEAVTLEDLNELTYLNCIWKEALRMHPPAFSLMRIAKRDVTLLGSNVKVKKGTVVQAVKGTSHTDPRVWKNPGEFRPERWSEQGGNEGDKVPGGAYMPFGAGQLSCAGRFLADYEAPVLIAEMYRKFSFQLECRPEEVLQRTCFVETAKMVRGDASNWVPFRVSLRKA